MTFELDTRLARAAFVIGDLPLSRLLLMNDARWPWLILVPRRDPAWRGPVWGQGVATPYDDGARVLIAAAREGLPIQSK